MRHSSGRGDSNNIAAAHGADLRLHEPLPEAGLVKHVLTIGNALQHLPLLELAETDRTVHVLCLRCLVELYWLQETHIGFSDLLRVGVVVILKAVAVGEVSYTIATVL